MANQSIFCEYCLKPVSYKVIDEKLTRTLKGQDYTFMGKTALCQECSHPIYVDEINELNKQALYKEFKKVNKIISNDDIYLILEKYCIGAKPLAQLLGWGINTIQRYLNGDIPKPTYSDQLKMILKEPKVYYSILEKNKEQLTTVAYQKTLEKVKECLDSEEMKKEDLVIRYLLSKNSEITPLALQKLLYYVQGFYFAFKGTFLFDSDCESWVHGPVYRDIYFKFQEFGRNPIAIEDKIDVKNRLTIFEISLLDSIVKNLSVYNGKVLEQFTHDEAPWLDARGDLKEDEPSNQIISKETIGDFFTKIKEKYQMLSVEEIAQYSKDKFKNVSL
ncbi:DUF4065 domain-containing protein [Streptococcus sanguinis]|uniref:type II toxin-antitoxin system antitoxin SocA domain-containing protein n=2 Tax=Streptococcus sanguinis TaxID=1305 RepID=UPI000F6650DF|nr:type II toxin-antitoxin system antitoxin SocA domain-containing protein [Streptococcus sanguinis]RSI20648.1 hypothetical protein D8884_03030 [Streptococcus sanguinis]